MKRILLGGLIHDRGEITDCYLRHLRELDLSGLEVSWFFVSDGRRQMHGFPMQAYWVEVLDDGPRWERKPRAEDEPEPRPEFRRMVFLRNILRERALMERVDALVSIDSDICAPPDLAQKLVAADHSWVAALVDNSAIRDKERDQELVRMRGGERHYTRPSFNILDFGEDGMDRIAPDMVSGGEADYTGAVCLYSRTLLERAAWTWDKSGEDGGFSRQAQAAGYRARYLPILCDHLMTPERLASHTANCDLCRG